MDWLSAKLTARNSANRDGVTVSNYIAISRTGAVDRRKSHQSSSVVANRPLLMIRQSMCVL